MANKYYVLDTADFSKWVTSVQNALIDKFGENVTIYTASSSTLTFTCDAISERAIQFTSASASCGMMSGSTYGSSKQFSECASSAATRLLKYLVLGDSFLLLAGRKESALIGKTINGISIHFGGTRQDSSVYYDGCGSHAYKDGEYIGTLDFVSFGRDVYCDTATPYKTPLLIINTSSQDDYIVRQADGTPDTIKDLYMSTYANSDNVFMTVSGLFSATNLYQADGSIHLRTALLAEF